MRKSDRMPFFPRLCICTWEKLSECSSQWGSGCVMHSSPQLRIYMIKSSRIIARCSVLYSARKVMQSKQLSLKGNHNGSILGGRACGYWAQEVRQSLGYRGLLSHTVEDWSQKLISLFLGATSMYKSCTGRVMVDCLRIFGSVQLLHFNAFTWTTLCSARSRRLPYALTESGQLLS